MFANTCHISKAELARWAEQIDISGLFGLISFPRESLPLKTKVAKGQSFQIEKKPTGFF